MKKFLKRIFVDEKRKTQQKAKKKNEIEQKKSMGPLFFLYKNQEYKPIGPEPEDFIEDETVNNNPAELHNCKTIPELKKKLWNGIGKKIRPKAWRILFKYTPLSGHNVENVLKTKREEYTEFKERNREEHFVEQNDTNMIETVKVIRKDVLRTLPESNLFRNQQIQNAMVRILTIYSIRHPSNFYSQGMNDILAPIFCVFVAESFQMTNIEIENNVGKMEKEFNELNLLNAEADAFHCFSLFLSNIKRNYIKGFDGVNENLQNLKDLVYKSDKELYRHFEENEIEIFHFGFRWCFCLLLREFPLNLAIKLIDFFLTEEFSQDELCLYLMLSLLLKYSAKVKTLQREQIIIFLQNLPTLEWGEKDVKLLVSEAFTLQNLFKLNQK